MSDRSPSSVSKPSVPVNEPKAGAEFEPYESPAGGWGALHATAQALREQSIVLKGSKALLSMNQPARLRLPGMCVAGPEAYQFIRVLRKWREGRFLRTHQAKGDPRVLRRLHRQRTGTAERLLAGGTRTPDRTDALQPCDGPLRADQLG